jgi:hypothetical protein
LANSASEDQADRQFGNWQAVSAWLQFVLPVERLEETSGPEERLAMAARVTAISKKVPMFGMMSDMLTSTRR